MILKCLGFRRSKKNSSSTKRPYPTVIEELSHPFSLEDIRKSTNNFDEVIGVGGYGKVYQGKARLLQLDHVATTTALVAVKRINVSYNTYALREFQKEVELLCQFCHPNLVSLIGFCIHKDERFIVYPYMSNGSLADCLFKRDQREPLSWKKRLEICIGVARAVHYLHTGLKRIIIHRDIKPSNILLDENMVPKLYDFGISLQGSLFSAKPQPIEGKRVVGTLGYMAPENIRDGILTDKCDVYSFGIVLLEVICANPIYTIKKEMHETNEEILIRLQAEDIDPALAGNIAPVCYEVYIDIIRRCLKLEANERPTMGEVEMLLEHALTLQQEAEATDTSDDYL
ncbi:putative receptor-like protein kinase At5g39000 [Lotus japonicus]|uniref:putative receptor-like protein kinase At5g39000 n=1 Tax=Lotus japonicus TaxID=34305 RepID=UPI0025831930|nr:putative receptor-like protein kinase At5g39000 [Lotus japonicus]XP_057447973.1 putative receptor-like protein kinase At5g39000 [Lotus japonicus]XP_057447974.1 putative receptor-like protein kinase At5g39000 [Lotus japonicus]